MRTVRAQEGAPENGATAQSWSEEAGAVTVPPRPHVGTLTRPMCERLLRAHRIGRVGLTMPDGPQILPVTYQYRTGVIYFRTSTSGVLSGLARRKLVAFEVDWIDEEEGTGWNVLVRGHSAGVVNDHLLRPLWETGPVPWSTGIRPLVIAITPHTIYGRTVTNPGV